VSEPFATRFGIKPGDTITLATPPTCPLGNRRGGGTTCTTTALHMDYSPSSATGETCSPTSLRFGSNREKTSRQCATPFRVVWEPIGNYSYFRPGIQDEIRKAMDETFIFNYA
jgi:hypothetical protein